MIAVLGWGAKATTGLAGRLLPGHDFIANAANTGWVLSVTAALQHARVPSMPRPNAVWSAKRPGPEGEEDMALSRKRPRGTVQIAGRRPRCAPDGVSGLTMLPGSILLVP